MKRAQISQRCFSRVKLDINKVPPLKEFLKQVDYIFGLLLRFFLANSDIAGNSNRRFCGLYEEFESC